MSYGPLDGGDFQYIQRGRKMVDWETGLYDIQELFQRGVSLTEEALMLADEGKDEEDGAVIRGMLREILEALEVWTKETLRKV